MEIPVARDFLYLLPLIVHVVYSSCNTSWETLNERLSVDTYKFYNPPWTHTGSQLDVGLKVGISSLKGDGQSALRMTVHLLQTWYDPRVCYNTTSLPVGQTTAALTYGQHGSLWSPDVYPEGAVSSMQHEVTLPNVFVRIYPNGTVLKSNRLSVEIQCPTSDLTFPHGSQHCIVRFKSFSFTKGELYLRWFEGGYTKLAEFTSNIDLDDVRLSTCAHNLFLDEQPCVEMDLYLTRDYDVFVLRIYLPSALVVLLSWLSLWIDVRQVPARTGLSVTCVLTLLTQCVGLMVMSDDSEGVLAVDVWLFICLTFTVVALATFVAVHYLDFSNQRRIQKATALATVHDEGKISPKRKRLSNEVERGRIERVMRVVYPILFVIFNVVYWSYFLSL